MYTTAVIDQHRRRRDFHLRFLSETSPRTLPISQQPKLNVIKPDGTVVDPVPSKSFRGSADAVSTNQVFASSAPLAEAENEPYDLGLVIESLTFESRQSWQPSLVLGPPKPVHMVKAELVHNHRLRSAPLYR